MKSFFKYFFASLLAMVLAFILAIFIVVGTIAGLMSGDGEKTIVVKENSTLVMEMNRQIVDRTANNPLESLDLSGISGFNNNSTIGLNTIIPESTIDSDLLIKGADDALYEGKKGGRNIIIVHNENNT